MKKIILSFCFILIFCKISSADTLLLWNSTMATMWANEVSGNTAIYQRLASEVTNNSCTANEFGIRSAIYYKITGNATYATQAYNQINGLIQQSSSQSADDLRERGVPIAIVYSMIYPALDSTQKANLDTQMTYYHDKALGIAPYQNSGTLIWDSDQLVGTYMGIVLWALAKGGHDSWLTECSPNSLYHCIGGTTPTGANTSTWRNAIYKYVTEHATGGEWIESSAYNTGTLRLLIMGVQAINGFYGVDKFPEITALYDDFADNYYNRSTPDYTEPFGWGDIETQQKRTHFGFRTAAAYYMMANLAPNSANMYDLADAVNSNSSCQLAEKYFFYKPSSSVARSKPAGVTSTNASGLSTAYWHSGWASTSSFFASLMADKLAVDHEMEGLSNFVLYRQNHWAINYPEGYPGLNWYNNSYLNNLLFFGAFSSMYEAAGQTAYESGSDFMYHAGASSGLYHQTGYYDPAPVFIKEYGRQIVYFHNTDNSDTIVLQDRLDACNPSSTSCMSSTKYARLPHDANDIYHSRVSGVSGKHQWILNTFGAVTDNGSGNFSWLDSAGTTVYLKTFIPSYSFTDINLATTGFGVSPYYFLDSDSPHIVSSNEAKHQLRLQVTPGTNSFEFNDWLNVIHTGSANPTTTQVIDTAGAEDAKGVLIDLAGYKRLVIFDDQRDTTTSFTSNINGPPDGFSVEYDPSRLTKTFGMSRFKVGSNVSFTTSDSEDIKVTLVGLKHTLTWTVTADGSSVSCTPSTADLCNFTVPGSSGSHTVVWAVGGGGGATCNDNCNICTNQVDCLASALTCYWHDSDGATALGCWNYQEQSVLCASDINYCNSQTLCVNQGYCWQDKACIAVCTPPPTGTTVDIDASEDILLRGGTNIDGTSGVEQQLTNFDTRALGAKTASIDVNFTRVTCLKFPITIPTDADINTVKLKFKIRSAGDVSGVVRAYKCLRNWTENQATWLKYNSSNNWSAAGARGNGTDIDGDWTGTTGALASYNVGGAEQVGDFVYLTDTGSFTDYVQENIGGAINVCIQQENQSGGANFFFYDSEDATAANHPQIEINYAIAQTNTTYTPRIMGAGVYYGKTGQ